MLYGEMPEVRLEKDAEPVRGFLWTIPNPPRRAVLRVPTRDELIAYTKKQARAKAGSYAADLELFKAIRVAGDDFDEYDARIAILKLTDASLVGSERTETGWKITLKTPFCEVSHSISIPTSQKMVSAVRTGKIGAELYDNAIESIDGYADGIEAKDVPEHHKRAVGAELVRLVDSLYDSNFLPNS